MRFTNDLHRDLARRDFTVNAIALDPLSGRWTDPFGGRADVVGRRLRTVGDPGARFREDALRLLRAARVAALLDMTVDPATRAAMQAEAAGIDAVSPERVRDELGKMLATPRPSVALRLLEASDLLARVLPELESTRGVGQNEFHAYDVYEHTLRTIDAVPEASDPRLRWVALFHDVGKVPTRAVRPDGRVTFHGHERESEALARRRMERLRFPKRDVRFVTHLIRHHMFHYESTWTDAAVRRFVARVGEEGVEPLFVFHAADRAAKGPEEPPVTELAELERRIQRERAREVAFRVRDLAVSGSDLIDELKLAPGPKIGTLLDELLEAVIEGRSPNERSALLAVARAALEKESDG